MANNTVFAASSASVLAVGAAVTLATATTSPSTTSTAPKTTVVAVSDADAARLARQATFGATPAVFTRIKTLGVNGWLDEQFATKSSSFTDLIAMDKRKSYCDTDGKSVPSCVRLYRDSLLPAMRFYSDALSKDDQLRQRVAFALFNMMPVSAVKVTNTPALARYEQIMLDGAFGNFGDLLKSVITSGAMAYYLDLADSDKSAPNENLPRELMQLFSIGPNSLDGSGNIRKDSTGATVPNYTTKDVTEVARALTGWTYARWPGVNPAQNESWDLVPALVANPAAFDSGAKTFLGTTIPAGASQQANLDAVVARLVSHPSTAPRVSRILIEALVKSNPSAHYINRVANVFVNNGKGVTGDLQAVVRAVLTDAEARTPDTTTLGGRLKDPIMLALSLARMVGMKSDGYAFTLRDVQMGQQYLRSASVFGDYPPDFPLPGVKNVISPASKLMTVNLVLERHNFVWQWTMSGDSTHAEYITPTWIPGAGVAAEDWSSWEAYGSNVDGIIDRINLLMLANQMTTVQRAALSKAMMLVTDPSPTLQARRRAQTGIYIVASSPMFQVDR
ncbi:DUF1800 domain-containing protein [Sphingomonas nostoxanthinifaciens]|uniref:DUF1800 domain-containing protein n=1 Tax=Sphingomonas nostoxanthinifaciens TaxID=2872652 RepID=UPI001CC20539|nr:DUF1800 domain-containing protein [Sphingomonas nostoxanthinifaciens]UAK23043.1 DUF1800 domain-containing protein [Sphingomonas nostoxanthinifaciens]